MGAAAEQAKWQCANAQTAPGRTASWTGNRRPARALTRPGRAQGHAALSRRPCGPARLLSRRTSTPQRGQDIVEIGGEGSRGTQVEGLGFRAGQPSPGSLKHSKAAKTSTSKPGGMPIQLTPGGEKKGKRPAESRHSLSAETERASTGSPAPETDHGQVSHQGKHHAGKSMAAAWARTARPESPSGRFPEQTAM